MPDERAMFERILPHRQSMLMLTSVAQQAEKSIHCTSIIKPQNPLLIDNHFPILGGLELLAQASGIMLAKQETSQRPKVGVIARIKSLQLTETIIPIAAEIHIHARFLGGNRDAAIIEGDVLMENKIFCSGTLMLATLPDLL
ncbi:MAG: hypothetical protein V3V12_00230 [Gammaproteobacteria bacterium]